MKYASRELKFFGNRTQMDMPTRAIIERVLSMAMLEKIIDLYQKEYRPKFIPFTGLLVFHGNNVNQFPFQVAGSQIFGWFFSFDNLGCRPPVV